LTKRNGAVAQPATRAVQPAREEARPNPSNRATAAVSTPANRQTDFSAPKKTESRATEPVNGFARTTSREIADDFSDDRGPQAPVPPVTKTGNGTAANGNARTSNRTADLPTVQTLQPKPEAAKPEASTAKASTPAVEIYRGYTIEAATSYTKELAEQFAAAYRKQGYDAAVESYNDERSGTSKYRVLIGAFATRPAAEQKAAQIAGILMKDYRVVGLK
jgi:hypothetical protein